ncbi:Piso0_000259 [Millerozyma farinosa CBS 7064]|uniref:Piso0_000259 protein n=1 Tax=Pichia sorbitophila (strain ATCC MYA-4447 / BCRC 22081 / CBS 7064 / NBRC 10061 / NRRL Y-12695) TaxID=559304 RepID=G8YTH9_PICSO|nr:Piso0_000259 [Millerozyma farinosa CBS 7064]
MNVDRELNDIEFDDTRIETPRELRRERPWIMQSSVSLSDQTEPNVKGRFLRSDSTSRSPFKGGIISDKSQSINMSSNNGPRLAGRDSAYRTRNGTPLKQVQNRSSTFETPLRVREKHKDGSSDKLISNDNRFSPNNSTSIRSGPQNPSNSFTLTPPSNLKVRPVSFDRQEGSTISPTKPERRKMDMNENDENKKSNQDIEFDSSDEEEYAIKNVESVQRPAPHSEEKKAKKDTSKVANHEVERNKEEDGDISRSEILERINATINSLIEKENSRPFLSSRQSPRSHISDENHSAQDDSSSSSPEDILNELDSFMSTKRKGDDNIHEKETAPLLEDSPRSTDPKKTASPTFLTKLSGKYAREVIRKRKYGENANTKPNQESSDVLWPVSKWSKLNRILKLKSLSRSDIINSDILLKKLGCKSKDDLEQRINFLISYNKVREDKKK